MATTEIYTLSLHDALPISLVFEERHGTKGKASEHFYRLRDSSPELSDLFEGIAFRPKRLPHLQAADFIAYRSEEHTSELQSQFHLVCRLLLEKKKEH